MDATDSGFLFSGDDGIKGPPGLKGDVGAPGVPGGNGSAGQSFIMFFFFELML